MDRLPVRSRTKSADGEIPTQGPNLALLLLPEELLVEVCKASDPESLLRIRLTCKKLCRASHDCFGPTFLPNRLHVISPYSLQTLIEMSAHPAARFMRKIGFNSTLMTYTQWFESPNPSRDRTVERQLEFLGSGTFVRQLTQVLLNLRRHGISVAMQILCNYPALNGYGSRELSRGIERHPIRPISNTYIAETVANYMLAVERSGCPVSRLSLDFLTGGTELSSGVAQAVMSLLEATQGTGGRLPGGLLEIRFFNPDALGQPAVMSYCRQDTNLKFTHFQPAEHARDLFDALQIWLMDKTFKRVILEDCTIYTSDFESIMEVCDNLAHLECRRTHFVVEHTWSGVMDWLAAEYDLEYCLFEEVNWRYETGTFVTWRHFCEPGEDALEKTGAEDVKAWLKQLALKFGVFENVIVEDDSEVSDDHDDDSDSEDEVPEPGSACVTN